MEVYFLFENYNSILIYTIDRFGNAIKNRKKIYNQNLRESKFFSHFGNFIFLKLFIIKYTTIKANNKITMNFIFRTIIDPKKLYYFMILD